MKNNIFLFSNVEKIEIVPEILMSLEKKILHIKSFSDSRGTLSVADMNDDAIPFSVKRVFWIYGIPHLSERGGHAHRTCHEALFAVNGSFKVELYDGNDKQKFFLDNPNEGLHIPPMVWCRLYDFSKEAVCLCLASEPYQKEGYIENIGQFNKETSHLK